MNEFLAFQERFVCIVKPNIEISHSKTMVAGFCCHRIVEILALKNTSRYDIELIFLMKYI
jgi:hypothetical protein